MSNGKFTDILKCVLWDFDKKNGYFLFLLSIVPFKVLQCGRPLDCFRCGRVLMQWV